jgi:hypothetical protein
MYLDGFIDPGPKFVPNFQVFWSKPTAYLLVLKVGI